MVGEADIIEPDAFGYLSYLYFNDKTNSVIIFWWLIYTAICVFQYYLIFDEIEFRFTISFSKFLTIGFYLKVGHSIGSHISLELFRRYQKKVIYCICLYPFLAADAASSKQATIRRIVVSPALSTGLSSLGAFLGFLPAPFSRFIAKKILGKSCSSSTVEVLCTHVLKYHVMRNMLFMAKTEFEKLPEKPDFDFIGGNKSKLAFLFGSDDHWGPLHLYEEIYDKVPDATLAMEREGHTHAFSCTDAGSTWVAQHVCSLIKNHLPNDILFHN